MTTQHLDYFEYYHKKILHEFNYDLTKSEYDDIRQSVKLGSNIDDY